MTRRLLFSYSRQMMYVTYKVLYTYTYIYMVSAQTGPRAEYQ